MADGSAPNPYSSQQVAGMTAGEILKKAMPNSASLQEKIPGFQSVAETLDAFGYPLLPGDQLMYATGEAGWQMEKPLVRYRAGLLPYVDTIFVLKWVRTADGGLELTTTVVGQIQLFGVGVGDPGGPSVVGTSMGAWWNLTSADSTLEAQGAPVYDGNSFWAFGHTISFEGTYIRVSGEVEAVTDPKRSLGLLDDGPGSYSEQMLQRAAMDVSLIISMQGSGQPRFLDVLAANGDRSQLIGGGRHSISLPTFPYARWMRPSFFGATNQYAKMSGTLTSSVDVQVGPIGGNEIPETVTAVYMQMRLRVYGLRVCGNPDDGC